MLAFLYLIAYIDRANIGTPPTVQTNTHDLFLTSEFRQC